MKRRSTFLFRLATLALVATAPLACFQKSGRRQNPFAAPGTGPGEGSIHVRVDNRNFNDATIHAIRGGERIRLGQVTGKSESTFKLKWNFSLPLAFYVDLIGGTGCNVREISVDPGDRVWVNIPVQIGATPCYAGKE